MKIQTSIQAWTQGVVSFAKRLVILGLAWSFLGNSAQAQQAIPLVERFEDGYEYQVSTRVKLGGKLSVPVGKDRPAEMVEMQGRSVIDYTERVLPTDPRGEEQKTFRIYKSIDFKRNIGDRNQEITLRPEVRRLVVIKNRQNKIPFSPDGPLTWGEIDLLRTDIFVPALKGLLPEKAVRIGDSWKATLGAVTELTDLEKVDAGSLECKFESIETLNQRKVAFIRLEGDLKGVNEDGPNRQRLTGRMYFDLQSNSISYISINGEHFLLDKDGKTVGKIEGEFVLTRTTNTRHAELTDAVLRRISLEPDGENTRLLYEDDAGVRFLYPRRWHIVRVQGRQITLDESNGSGLLITLETPRSIPDVTTYLRETSAVLTERKAVIRQAYRPERVQATPMELDRFRFDAEVGGQRVSMVYFVARSANGGATFAGRVLENDSDTLLKEVERIAVFQSSSSLRWEVKFAIRGDEEPMTIGGFLTQE